MEIIPFLRLSGQRLLVLWLVAGLAGAAGAFYANTLPVSYTGESTVFLERVYPGLRYEREPFVANYESAVRFLTAVHERVGGQVGMTTAGVGNALDIEVPPGGDFAYVRFTADNADTAVAGAEALANQTLITLTNETVVAAQAALDRAAAAEAEAQSQVDAVTVPLQVVDVEREHQVIDDQVKELEKQIATLAPTDPAAANVQALLDFRRERRAVLAAALPAYRSAKLRLDTLQEAHLGAQTAYDTAVARVAVAENGEAVVNQGATPESGLQKMVRFGGAAAILAAVLVLLVFVAIEAMNRPRRSQQQQAQRVQPPRQGPPVPAQPPVGAPAQTNGVRQPIGAAGGRPPGFQARAGDFPDAPPQRPLR
jgi:hypothetical protein